MPVPYMQQTAEYPHIQSRYSTEVPVVFTALREVFSPKVAALPSVSTLLTLRESADGTKKRLEAANGHSVVCLTYKFNNGADSLEILDLDHGKGQRTVVQADGSRKVTVGAMARTKYGTEFQGVEQESTVDADRAASDLSKYRALMDVAERCIR